MFDTACDEGPDSSGGRLGADTAGAAEPGYVPRDARGVRFRDDGDPQVWDGVAWVPAQCDVFWWLKYEEATLFADVAYGVVFRLADLPPSAAAAVERAAGSLKGQESFVVFW